jgi:TolB-like protein/Flp pilus assembly protein TadD
MIGQTLSHYRITAKLGEGGMGAVYRAEDTTLNREVALKILPPELARSEERLERFQREAQTLAALDHPNIVTIFSVEEEDDLHFLTMQLVEGRPLSETIPQDGMSLDALFDIAIPLSEALAAAHEAGVVHRDLKPANVMVGDDGRVRVLDFGLAKLRPQEEASVASDLPTEALTQEGRIVGTMPYMSPEQLEGREVDARSDIFSLGVMLYEMVTGERPFKGDTSVSLISSIVKDTPIAVDVVRDDLPHHLGRVISRCLEKSTGRRYQSAIEVRNELEALKAEIDSGVVRPSSAEAAAAGPPRRRHWWPLAVGGAVVLILMVTLWTVLTRAPTADGGEVRSLAVLPLTDLAGEAAPEYFAEGMTEALITDLSKISALRVISRTSVMRYKETEKSIPEVAEELGVDAVVEGSVLLAGDDVRITAQLIDGTTDEHLWAESYTRPLEDVLALHSEIARAIADEIEVVLTADEASRLTSSRSVDPEALRAYLQGLYFWNRRTPEGFQRAAGLFQQAIGIEPDYALAHAGLANTYVLLGNYGLLELDRAYGAGRAAARQALLIDDTLAEAHTALGELWLFEEWDWSNAERHFRRAIALNPSYATARQYYAELLSYLGRREEALAEIQHARELDPLSLVIGSAAGEILNWAGQRDAAIEELQRVLGMDPEFWRAHRELGRVYLTQQDYEEAAEAFERAIALWGGNPHWRGDLACARAALGRTDEALEILVELESDSPPRAWYSARANLCLGDTEEALAWLKRSVDERDPGSLFLKSDPLLDPLREDPRFEELLKRMNFPD